MNRTPLGYRGAYDTVAAAEYLSCSVDVIERLIADGHLETWRPIGMKRGQRISRTELDRYIEASQATDEATAPLKAVAS